MTYRRQKFGLLTLLSILLVSGFLSTSLAGYFVSVSSMRQHIVSTALPLTGDTVYSEIQRDLLRPVFISSLMANDTFLKDWITTGEQDERQISQYLAEIKQEYSTYSSFLVSERTRRYYYGEGILKQVQEDEPRDTWYFRIRSLDAEYETNVDPDMANEDSLTVFVNHKIHDASGAYLGATGVGLTIDSISELIARYSQTYGYRIYFVDPQGDFVLRGDAIPVQIANLRELEGFEKVAEEVLSQSMSQIRVQRASGLVHINSRFIPELNWHLIVEQAEGPLTQSNYEALLVNLAICASITLIILGLTYISIGAYQRRLSNMFNEERKLRKEVNTLSGLLPICASCKSIRGEEGYWKQVEEYVSEHTEAEFSHGICPKCMEKLYPEINPPSKDEP